MAARGIALGESLLLNSIKHGSNQIRVIPDSLLGSFLDQRFESRNQPQELRSTEKPQSPGNLQTGGQGGAPTFPLVDDDGWYLQLQSELNDRGLSLVQSGQSDCRQGPGKLAYCEPCRRDPGIAGCFSFIELAAYRVGTEELVRELARDIQAADSRERDERTGVDDEALRHPA